MNSRQRRAKARKDARQQLAARAYHAPIWHIIGNRPLKQLPQGCYSGRIAAVYLDKRGNLNLDFELLP